MATQAARARDAERDDLYEIAHDLAAALACLMPEGSQDRALLSEFCAVVPRPRRSARRECHLRVVA